VSRDLGISGLECGGDTLPHPVAAVVIGAVYGGRDGGGGILSGVMADLPEPRGLPGLVSWASFPLADVTCGPVQPFNSCTVPHVGRRFLPGLLRGIGPEVLAAASDNDPTNVGTAAAVGAQRC
jgi:hypothetical protein